MTARPPLTLYLSGPMSSLPEFNFRAFADAAARWRAKGFAVISPADNFGGQTDLPKEVYMRADLLLLLGCDGIVLLKGWSRSEGAKLERAVAEAIGLEVFEDE